MGTDRRPSLLACLLVLIIAIVAVNAQNNSGNGSNNGNGGSNGNSSSGTGASDASSTHYLSLPKKANSNQERVICRARGKCFYKILTCPKQCPQRKPKKNKKNKGCFIDCSNKCEVTCKWRRPKCTGYGSLCYDPRFVGGDGVMFYFHGAKGGNFAIISDDNIQINARFIGTRPQGRTRDFTWVQALSVMFDTHTLVIAARRISQWQDNMDALILTWDGDSVSVPTEGETEWKTVTEQQREVSIERTDDLNTLRIEVSGIVEMAIKIRPIGEEENRVHNYQIPSGDSFAHLETQFKFSDLSDNVEGVLGKTYRPDYVSPVKVGVKMPMLGGEDKYETPSLHSTSCRVCRFERPAAAAAAKLGAQEEAVAQY